MFPSLLSLPDHPLAAALMFLLALPLFLCNLAADTTQPASAKRTTIACVGDSITAGAGAGNGNSYPDQLATMLGDGYAVHNFGVSGATLLNHGNNPYQKQAAFTKALKSAPDLVIIMLGTNDTKAQNWKFKDEYYDDYKGLVQQFQALESKPRIFVCLPPPVLGKGAFAITNDGVDALIPIIQKLAKDLNVSVIDMNGALAKPAADNPKLIPDTVHPGKEGHTLMAQAAYKAVTGKELPTSAPATQRTK